MNMDSWIHVCVQNMITEQHRALLITIHHLVLIMAYNIASQKLLLGTLRFLSVGHSVRPSVLQPVCPSAFYYKLPKIHTIMLSQ